MPSDVRIQLEGRLEKVERAARTWEKVAHSLRGETWRGGALFPVLQEIAPDVEATVQEVQRKAGAAPEVQKVLTRLERAKEAVRARAVARLGRVGAAELEGDTPQLLARLEDEARVVHRERLGWSWGMPMFMSAMFAFMSFLQWSGGRRSWAIGLIPAAAIPIAIWLQSTRVLLTSRTLVLGRHTVPLSDVVLVRAWVAEAPTRRGKQCELEVYSRTQAVVRVSSSGRPTALIHALEGRGVKCEVHPDWKFFL